MRNDGKSYAISARKAGRECLWQVTRWDSSYIDNTTDYVRQNPGTLDRHQFRIPTEKLEKIESLGRLKTAEIQSYVLKGVGLNTYQFIESRNPDLKELCKTMKNQLNALDCAKCIDIKEPAIWDIIDSVDGLNNDELLVLVQSINIQNKELYKRKDKFVLSVLQQACLKLRFHITFSKTWIKRKVL